MTAGNVSPDFTRTVNVYDSQGGSQPVTFSFVKTGANTWAYEASYAGDAANLTATDPDLDQAPSRFNSDGTLANVNGAAPASGNVSSDHSLEAFDLGPRSADHHAQPGHGRRQQRPDPGRCAARR